MTEVEIFDQENWYDYGLTDHIEDTDKFPHWVSVGEEMARIAGCEEDSPMWELFMQCAASAAKLGFECSECGAMPGSCRKCEDKAANVQGQARAEAERCSDSPAP